MCTWLGKSIWNCFWFLDVFYFFNCISLTALCQQPFLRGALCQLYSLVSCINHTARPRSQQSATQPALKSRTFHHKHIHLFVRTDGRINPGLLMAVSVPSHLSRLCALCLGWLSATTAAQVPWLPAPIQPASDTAHGFLERKLGTHTINVSIKWILELFSQFALPLWHAAEVKQCIKDSRKAAWCSGGRENGVLICL